MMSTLEAFRIYTRLGSAGCWQDSSLGRISPQNLYCSLTEGDRLELAKDRSPGKLNPVDPVIDSAPVYTAERPRSCIVSWFDVINLGCLLDKRQILGVHGLLEQSQITFWFKITESFEGV